MIDCAKRSHKPICDWVAKNVQGFKLPAESGECAMYDFCGTCAHKKCDKEYPCENDTYWEAAADE